ncbi:MAG: hypothetical protein ACFFDU_09200 [Candidatus Thorarchaeota archaeon]
MASPNNQKSHNYKPTGLHVMTRNTQEFQSGISRLLNSILNKCGRLFDLTGTLAALFTIIDMCLVWYGAYYTGIMTSGISGYLIVGDLLVVLQIELMFIAPLSLMWILAKFRGWI